MSYEDADLNRRSTFHRGVVHRESAHNKERDIRVFGQMPLSFSVEPLIVFESKHNGGVLGDGYKLLCDAWKVISAEFVGMR